MFRVLSLIACLGFVLLAADVQAQCNVRSQSNDVSAAAALQQAQIQQLLALQAVPQASTATSATAVAGGAAINPLAVQQLALLQAQQRAATASALALPAVAVQPVCSSGSCGSSRVRAASRAVTRPIIQRPARSRSFSRSVSVSRA